MRPQFFANELRILFRKPNLNTRQFDDLVSATNCRLEPISPLERKNGVARPPHNQCRNMQFSQQNLDLDGVSGVDRGDESLQVLAAQV